jgi:hypothetical protein
MSAVLIVLIVFGFVALIVKMGLEHDRQNKSAPDNSLTTSELRRMIAESVEDATIDLRDRMDRMERRLERPDTLKSLPPAEELDEKG